MSISSISSNYGYYQAGGGHQQRKQEIDALSQALQSGDLSSAQQAFSALFSTSSNQVSSSSDIRSSANCDDGIVADISALGKALSSGDLTTAQSAFSSLQEDIQNGPPPPPPPGGPGGPGQNGDQVQQAFSDLASALENNDLDAAQAAFETLQALAPDTQTDAVEVSSDTSTAVDSTDTIDTDLSELSDALQAGDLASAQMLFQTLLEDLQANAPRHPGVHQYSQNSSSSSDSSTTVSVSA